MAAAFGVQRRTLHEGVVVDDFCDSRSMLLRYRSVLDSSPVLYSQDINNLRWRRILICFNGHAHSVFQKSRRPSRLLPALRMPRQFACVPERPGQGSALPLASQLAPSAIPPPTGADKGTGSAKSILCFDMFCCRAICQYTMKAKEPKKARGHVKWDEVNLNNIESNKPEREKITEPKTPYHPMIDEDEGTVSPIHLSEDSVDKSAHADAIKTALAEAVCSGKIFDRNSWESCDNEEAVKQGTAFDDHRKVHYDEYHKMKQLLQKGTMNDEADEDESEPVNRKS
ncbi:hypothetical protein U9M48_022873 [Paspalum notatum var. saurae]|uniref:Protein phosphatase inhibitor 2 n=1 Tax=Paspalum notatum var. saurae TaxID=547442 RepID=A0AAQ3WVK8_PASNO